MRTPYLLTLLVLLTVLSISCASSPVLEDGGPSRAADEQDYTGALEHLDALLQGRAQDWELLLGEPAQLTVSLTSSGVEFDFDDAEAFERFRNESANGRTLCVSKRFECADGCCRFETDDLCANPVQTVCFEEVEGKLLLRYLHGNLDDNEWEGE